jgi:hypothetical protein
MLKCKASIGGWKNLRTVEHSEFKIGCEFLMPTGVRWRCTDVGTRTILAIELEPGRDPSWLNGPPYAVAEVPFDEDAITVAVPAPMP